MRLLIFIHSYTHIMEQLNLFRKNEDKSNSEYMKPSKINFLDDDDDEYMKPLNKVLLSDEDIAEELLDKVEKRFSEVPTFGKSIYDRVDRLIPMTRHLVEGCNDRKKDVTLIGYVNYLGAYISPMTSFFHYDKEYHTNQYHCVFAPSTSGKGKLDVAYNLFDFANSEREQQFKEAHDQWGRIQKENRIKDNEYNSMEEPVQCALSIGGSPSDARIVEVLNENNKHLHGAVMYYPEIDHLTNSLKKENNKNFTSNLRCAFDHATIENSVKGTNKTMTVRRPKAGFLGSGTFDQIAPFFGGSNSSNGTIQRFMFYTFHATEPVRSKVPRRNKDGKYMSMEDRHRLHCEKEIKALLGTEKSIFLVPDGEEDKWEKDLDEWADDLIQRHSKRHTAHIKRSMIAVYRMAITLQVASEKHVGQSGIIDIDYEYFQLAKDICTNMMDNTLLTCDYFIFKTAIELNSGRIHKQEQKDAKIKKEVNNQLRIFNDFKTFNKDENFLGSDFTNWYVKFREPNITASKISNLWTKIKKTLLEKGIIEVYDDARRGKTIYKINIH